MFHKFQILVNLYILESNYSSNMTKFDSTYLTYYIELLLFN